MLMMVEKLYALKTLTRYWPGKVDLILSLPYPQSIATDVELLTPNVVKVRLPIWAQDVGVEGVLLVPSDLVLDGAESAWKRTDWPAALFWYLNGTAERYFEKQKLEHEIRKLTREINICKRKIKAHEKDKELLIKQLDQLEQ